MVSAYAVTGEAFSAERPRPWSEARIPSDPPYRFRRFALHPDGQRFAYFAPPEGAVVSSLHATLVFNFFEELRRAAPPDKR